MSMVTADSLIAVLPLNFKSYLCACTKGISYQRVFLVLQLKRAKIITKEIVNFYCCCGRPVLEYACEEFHFALPKYLSE